MSVELRQTLQAGVHVLSVSMERQQLRSKNVHAWLDVTWDLECLLVSSLDDEFVCPCAYSKLATEAVQFV
jgi:hypothetical protein